MNLQAGIRRIAILWGNIQGHNSFGSVDRQIFDSSTWLQQTWLHLFATTLTCSKGMLILKRFSRIRKLELNLASTSCLISHQTNFDAEIHIWHGGINQTRCINFSIPEPLGDDFFCSIPRSLGGQDEFWCVKIHLVSWSKRWNVTQSHYGLHIGAVKLQGNGAMLVNEANSARIWTLQTPFFFLNWLFLLWNFHLERKTT